MINKSSFLTSFFIFIAFGLNAQNDFRKMNWYDSPETLMEKYSEVDFLRETEMGMTAYSHFDYVGGIETRIAFCFINDEFVAGVYQFTPERSSYNAKDFVKDFDFISGKLQAKYEMERSDVWYGEEMYTGGNYGFDYYLREGDVELKERGLNEGVSILHLLKNYEGSITHQLFYSSNKLMEMVQNSLEDDF